MISDKTYLNDVIMDTEVISKFQTECDNIADQTFNIAKQNAVCLEEISKVMESHNEIMNEYTIKRNELQVIL